MSYPSLAGCGGRLRWHPALLVLLVAFLLAACTSTSIPPTGYTTAPGQPTAVLSTLTPTATPVKTLTPTPGPGLADLLGTPNARAAAADLDGAIVDYQALATLYPNRAEPWMGLAAIAQRKQDWEAARRYLETAASVDPRNKEALRQWALFLEARGDYANVVEVYDRMVTLSPADANLLVARAQAYARTGQPDVAINDLNAAEALDRNREYAWLNSAGAGYGNRQYQAAITIATAGLKTYPQSTGLYMQRGLAYMSLGDLDKAIADFDSAIALDDGLPPAYHWKGRALLAQGDYPKAAETLQKSADLGVTSGVEDVNLAYESMAYAADALSRSDVSAAFAYLADKVIRYGSRDALLMGYGLARWRQGGIDQAITRMDGLVKSGYVPALYWRGAIYAGQHDKPKAVLDLKYFLGVRRFGPDAESARALLTSLGVDPGVP